MVEESKIRVYKAGGTTYVVGRSENAEIWIGDRQWPLTVTGEEEALSKFLASDVESSEFLAAHPLPEPSPLITLCSKCEGTGSYEWTHGLYRPCGICNGTGRIGEDGSAYRSVLDVDPADMALENTELREKNASQRKTIASIHDFLTARKIAVGTHSILNRVAEIVNLRDMAEAELATLKTRPADEIYDEWLAARKVEGGDSFVDPRGARAATVPVELAEKIEDLGEWSRNNGYVNGCIKEWAQKAFKLRDLLHTLATEPKGEKVKMWGVVEDGKWAEFYAKKVVFVHGHRMEKVLTETELTLPPIPAPTKTVAELQAEILEACERLNGTMTGTWSMESWVAVIRGLNDELKALQGGGK